MLIALYEQLDNLMNQRNQINNKMGTAPDLETFNQYKQQSDNIQNQITNLRGQILNIYTNAESAATAGTSVSGGSYTYSGNSEEFVNTFNNSSFNKGVLAGKGEMVAAIAEEYGLDPNLLASIMALETGWGTSSAIKNYNNPGGMMDPSSNWMSLKHYSSLEEGIRAVAKNLKENYIDQGLTTISSIGAKYCPVGAANDPNGTNSGWVPSVTSIYNQLTGANITSTTQLM
ncbi:TPA: glucosaminidase domain-containing protein [Candidatus Galligastranaerophilus gallistercoris]|nr:glucosaminidase domain-containing protein [Candidatus Galligastranaerophilus gallistercoris]